MIHQMDTEDILRLVANTQEIPYWNKYTLSIEEAAGYFRIGECKLRKIITENPTADFILWNGNRMQIKRKKFEEFIDRQGVIQCLADTENFEERR